MDFAAGRQPEPARWLEIAGKLLAARDLIGCKRLTERAVEADPHLPGADELLAVADVLLASQRLLPSGRPDPVAVLLLQPDPDAAAVKRSFSRLSELLSSPRNPHPAAATALRFVQEAFADLPDNLKNAPADPPPPPASGDAAATADAFWTACPYCCHVYQYQRALMGRALRCQSAGCRRAFLATEIPTVPPIVPGTDMYYCAWGFVPMGFPKAADLTTNWKPFCPMFPSNQSSPQPASAPQQASVPQPASAPQQVSAPQPASAGAGKVHVENNGGPIHANATPANAQPVKNSGVSGSAVGPPRAKVKKTTARKKVGAALKKNASGGVEGGIELPMLGSLPLNSHAGNGQTAATRGININEVAKPAEGSTILNFGSGEDIGFDLDVDATDAILGNLQHLPFLREDDNNRRMF
ncbi:hypothetical protein EJB05_11231, partial [Eragrostis curvula]